MDSLRPGPGTYYQFAKALKLSEGHLDCHFGSFWRETAVTRPWLGRHLRRSWHLKSREHSRSTWPQMGHRWNTDGSATKASRRPVTSSLSKICEAKLHPAVTCILQEFTSAPWTNGAVSAVRMPGTPWVGVMRWSGIGIGDDTGLWATWEMPSHCTGGRRNQNKQQTSTTTLFSDSSKLLFLFAPLQTQGIYIYNNYNNYSIYNIITINIDNIVGLSPSVEKCRETPALLHATCDRGSSSKASARENIQC